MSRLVNLSDAVYEELTKLKRVRNASYSKVIESLFRNKQTTEKISWAETIDRQLERDRRYRGKKERIDYDLVAYGVSRDSA